MIKYWDASNISRYFLYIRILGSISWISYAILSKDIYIGLSYTVTLTSSLLVTYVKFTPKNNNELNLESSEA